ncbi:hypothetical protein AL036_01540 [Salipiger aestuarii]|uniref:50S ribosomal protein L35 n=1 Tax=Salipiger aestuarii TaxID=568098 RepID=A0A327YW73_9RHOB|nr:hypothetical protein [Salipiger aestuarii]EIE51146.1 hypothetical protein C357_10017 [Citreicella sp. 357]KAA8610173.1 hypothetical protein AL036_01540 [Salipiger aestuarii]KAA8616017.1 hypothetical protein AL037_01960 [Salipiger aestuarii]KAB2543372.1 hypothetical protein AL035_02655 [Salipiger aestuarii]RAK23955.1 hypothetical protein ATI53_100162 [Salipiger aestuarii]
MQPDQYLVLGLCLVALSIPAVIAAWADRRAPRAGAVLAVAGLAAVLHGNAQQPGGYRLADIPDAIYGVIGAVIR